MRKLVYLVASTLDGFIAAPTREDPTGSVFQFEGDHAEPLLREYPEMVPTHLRSVLGIEDVPHRHFDTVVEGRVSYQMGVDLGVPDAYTHLRHYVFSRTMTEAPGPAVQVVNTDPAEKIRELKKEDGKDIWLVGGGALAGALRDEVDELHLKLYPVVIGSGAPLFDAGFSVDSYRMADSRTFESGVALLRYVRA
ncbi:MULTISPECIES: dihydrofolate reductase family protein [unclassified Amycolatopsis]|uniref:dihydrofolate reductase family protein n=1 Tax=unclassified Amycolatopsis TaxID=2618356 RepID=UPI001EE8F663|nr:MULTISPECIES: dihydrofolate reductase family protein [unclassified Amycolatopsis]MCG3753827.1 dihydrofolate reductase family protein [Amycolatopsis sp. Poz14]